MSQESPPSPPQDLSASGLTIPSDSEAYSSLSPPSSSPPQSSSNNHGEGEPVVLYQPPTVWSILRGAAINLLLPFINGMMLGFGELLAHEFAFRLGWGGTNVSYHISPYASNAQSGGCCSSIKGSRKVNCKCRILSQPMVVLQILSYVSWINPLPIQVWPKNRASRAHIVGPGVEMRDDPVERRRRNNSLDRDRRSATSLE